MKVIIDIDENTYTRLFDNGIEDYAIVDDHLFAIAKAIRKRETLQQDSCEDCISRQATVERLCKVAEFMNEKRNGLGSPYVMAALFIQDNKDEFPSVTPAPKMGHWIDGHCSECGCDAPAYIIDWKWKKDMDAKYCPNCGTKMSEIPTGSESEKIDCKSTKCENCINHNYCDYEPQKSEG